MRSRASDGLSRTWPLLGLLALAACTTRMLDMPTPLAVPSPAGQTVEVGSIADERAQSVLGKVDSVTIDSGPDLPAYVEGELTNALSRLGFAVRQEDRSAPVAGHKRVLATLLSAEVSSESSLMYPVVATVRVRIELIDESAQSTFRKEIRGATSRDLGFHTQGVLRTHNSWRKQLTKLSQVSQEMSHSPPQSRARPRRWQNGKVQTGMRAIQRRHPSEPRITQKGARAQTPSRTV